MGRGSVWCDLQGRRPGYVCVCVCVVPAADDVEPECKECAAVINKQYFS